MDHEIKFRYWDQFNGCMVYSDKFKNLFEFFRNYQLSVDGGNDPILEPGFNKDGIDVYAGDIVTGDSSAILDVVRFSSGCFCLSRAAMYYEATYWGDEIKIKGNIHENQDLFYLK